VIVPGTPAALQDEETTLGELFKSVGYSTAYFGKWHLGPEQQSLATSQGYDEWRVGFYGTSDTTEYRTAMTRAGMPKKMIEAVTSNYSIFEIDRPGGKPKKIRPYDLEYRKRIEGDIATAAVNYIKRKAKANEPFHIQIGWTRPHFPNLVTKEFENTSGIGQYGDSLVEHDYQVGRVLDAIKEAGIEDNTIVIYISDNGPTRTTGTINELNMGSAGPFTGELGDGKEGSIRTAGMIKWPGRIAPGVSNEMISIHDFFPTLANIIGAKLPEHHIDGVDQTDWLLGKKRTSNRDSLITFIGDRIVAVRWKQFRFYPVSFTPQPTNQAMMGYGAAMLEHAGYPNIFNIEEDPREERSVLDTGAWAVGSYLRVIADYKNTLKE
jgi:arylsulfatase